MDNKLNGNLTLSIDKEGKRLMLPSPCDVTLDPMAMIIEGE